MVWVRSSKVVFCSVVAPFFVLIIRFVALVRLAHFQSVYTSMLILANVVWIEVPGAFYIVSPGRIVFFCWSFRPPICLVLAFLLLGLLLGLSLWCILYSLPLTAFFSLELVFPVFYWVFSSSHKLFLLISSCSLYRTFLTALLFLTIFNPCWSMFIYSLILWLFIGRKWCIHMASRSS